MSLNENSNPQALAAKYVMLKALLQKDGIDAAQMAEARADMLSVRAQLPPEVLKRLDGKGEERTR